jgi:hypothetical protein
VETTEERKDKRLKMINQQAKLADKPDRSKRPFVQELMRARELWRQYPHLMLEGDDDLPDWTRDERAEKTEEEPRDADLLAPFDASAMDEASELHGALQLLRTALPFPRHESGPYAPNDGRVEHWWRQWAGYLPALLDHLDWNSTSLVAVAAAAIHTQHDINTPFEWFITELLDKAQWRPLTYDDVLAYVVDDPDGNMRERWHALMRAEQIIKTDHPNGVRAPEKDANKSEERTSNPCLTIHFAEPTTAAH